MNRIYVAGIGPGDGKYLTQQVRQVLDQCTVIVGYRVYVELLRKNYPDKQFLATSMGQEKERCRLAYEEAEKGNLTAVVCSGDAGVYGMAGLMYQIGLTYPGTELIVLSGVTAALAGAAVLGAPLMHDFAVISLSDLLTPWETISQRLVAASMADFVICLYNPSSRNRADYLRKACCLMMEYKLPETVCGIVRNAGRQGESYEILSLKELKDRQTDMFTTVYIGNKQTMKISGKMVTPRGYRDV